VRPERAFAGIDVRSDKVDLANIGLAEADSAAKAKVHGGLEIESHEMGGHRTTGTPFRFTHLGFLTNR
jgi:hypothetical protein